MPDQPVIVRHHDPAAGSEVVPGKTKCGRGNTQPLGRLDGLNPDLAVNMRGVEDKTGPRLLVVSNVVVGRPQRRAYLALDPAEPAQRRRAREEPGRRFVDQPFYFFPRRIRLEIAPVPSPVTPCTRRVPPRIPARLPGYAAPA